MQASHNFQFLTVVLNRCSWTLTNTHTDLFLLRDEKNVGELIDPVSLNVLIILFTVDVDESLSDHILNINNPELQEKPHTTCCS